MSQHFARFIQNQTSPGLIIVSQDMDIGQAIGQLLIGATTDAEELENGVLFVLRDLG